MKPIIISWAMWTICMVAAGTVSGQELKMTQPLWPASSEVCREHWDHNSAVVSQLSGQFSQCTEQCTSRKINTSIDRGYASVCGGVVAGIAIYKDCEAIYDAKERAADQANKIDRQCRAAVANRQAADAVWDASKKDSTPQELQAVRDTSETLSAEVSTSNEAVDEYREEAQKRALNATTTLQMQGLKYISRPEIEPTSQSASQVRSVGGDDPGSAPDCERISVAVIQAAIRASKGGTTEAEVFADCGGSGAACREMAQNCETK